MGSRALSSGECRVRDLVRGVVADLAPDELPMVDGLFRHGDETIVRRLNGRGQRREPLGFGAGEIAMLITPVVWLVLDQVARRLTDAGLERAERGSTAVLRRLFRRSHPPVTMPPLTREQLVEVRRLVLETAEQRGLRSERSTEIANAVVVGLTLAGPEAPGGGRSNATGGGRPEPPRIDDTTQQN